MRFFTTTTTTTISNLLTLLVLLPTALTLTITSPTASNTIDPGLPLTITWTSDPSDPSTISLFLIHTSSSQSTTLATSLATASGSYVVPSWWVLDWGTGYELQAQADAGGDVLASVGDLSLAGGLGEITTDSTGGLAFVTTAGVVSASGSVGSGDVSILSADATGTAAESASASAVNATGSEGTGMVGGGSSSSGSNGSSGSASETGLSVTASATTTTAGGESDGSSATESTAAAASETNGDAAGSVRAVVGGVLGAVAVALMA